MQDFNSEWWKLRGRKVQAFLEDASIENEKFEEYSWQPFSIFNTILIVNPK